MVFQMKFYILIFNTLINKWNQFKMNNLTELKSNNKLNISGIKSIDLSLDLEAEIRKLKKEMNAVILAH